LISNQAYSREVGPLTNPHNDAEIVGGALRSVGFEVFQTLRDARRAEILTAVRQFSIRLSAAGPGAIGFVYYSGHGAAETDNNTNYLIPIDAPEPGAPTFWDEALKLDDVLKLLQNAREASKFVVFDACRNELATPEKGSSKGFVPVAEQAGMFIAYATAAGRTASDRGARGGPYSNALAREIVRPGLHHLDLFQNVKEAVAVATNGSQQPWESNGLARRVFLAGITPSAVAQPAPLPAALPPPGQQGRLSEAAEAWTLARDTTDIAVLEAFVRRYGDTFYADLARSRISALNAERQRTAAPSRTPEGQPSAPPASADQREVNRSVQAELERVGCGPVSVDGTWGPASRKALEVFGRRTGLSLEVDPPNAATLAALRQHSGRACPVQCSRGEVLRDGSCVQRQQVKQAPRPAVAAPKAAAKPVTGDRCGKWRECVRGLPTRDTLNIYSTPAVLACGQPPTGCTR
jgi:uncharacterized caspase-like protein